MPTRFALFIGCMLWLASCSIYGDAQTSDRLAPDTSWELILLDVEGTRIVPERDRLGQRMPDMHFAPSDAGAQTLAVHGFLGCNLFSGTARIDGESVQFTELTQTEIACQPYPAQVEGRYSEALQHIDAYSIVDETLTLRYDRGVLTFRPAVPASN
ncbi:MAG: META domain-containing protein [Rhodothermales bacterium]